MHKATKSNNRQFDEDAEDMELEFGETKLADGSVVKAKRQPLQMLPEMELLQPRTGISRPGGADGVEGARGGASDGRADGVTSPAAAERRR